MVILIYFRGCVGFSSKDSELICWRAGNNIIRAAGYRIIWSFIPNVDIQIIIINNLQKTLRASLSLSLSLSVHGSVSSQSKCLEQRWIENFPKFICFYFMKNVLISVVWRIESQCEQDLIPRRTDLTFIDWMRKITSKTIRNHSLRFWWAFKSSEFPLYTHNTDPNQS